MLLISHHLHLYWKFKIWAGKFLWGVKAKHCWVLSTNFWKQKICWQHSAMFCLYTSSKLSPIEFGFSLKVVGSYPDNLHKSFLRSLDRKNKNLLLCKLESWCGVSATWITVAPLLTSLMASAWGTLVSWRTSPSAIRYSRLLGGCWGWTCWPPSRTCPWTTPTCLSPTWITAPAWIEEFPWWSEAVIKSRNFNFLA